MVLRKVGRNGCWKGKYVRCGDELEIGVLWMSMKSWGMGCGEIFCWSFLDRVHILPAFTSLSIAWESPFMVSVRVS
jgi:hypothetical protein